jgi:hypothetical protein
MAYVWHRPPRTHLHGAALALTDRLQQRPGVRLDQEAVILLVLCPPDFQHAHGGVAQLHGAHVNLGACAGGQPDYDVNI